MTTRTASGENCDPSALTAAHRSLPCGTKVRVENLRNGRWVVVRIKDRGPYSRGRIIDVTQAAARGLDFLSSGTTKVRLTVMSGEFTRRVK
jgi:rare lipoprotein A